MNFGNWLLRSVRGDAGLSESPVSVIERLNSLRPLRDVDKDTLLGAVLVLAPSLQLALQMLQELLPPDESRGRVGEVLCPTLWLLQNSLTDTLRNFSGEGQAEKVVKAFKGEGVASATRGSSTGMRPQPTQHREADRASSMPISLLATAIERRDRPPTPPNTGRNFKPLEDFPALHGIAPSPGRPTRTPDSAADLSLMKDLRAEMRVNAAIQVAIDSLEFVEGQLQIVKEVNRLKGGSSYPGLPLSLSRTRRLTLTGFELLQKHFYTGYNRILFRALELERREFDSPPYAASLNEDYEPEQDEQQRPGTQPSVSISFESPLTLPELPPMQLPPLPPLSPERRAKENTLGVERGAPVRRNTTQGVEGEFPHEFGLDRSADDEVVPKRQQFKRRLSLAEELAMAGDDSDSEAYSSEGDELDETPDLKPQPESDSSSGSEEEDSEEDSPEEAPGENESPVGDSDSDSEDTSVDGEDGSDEDGGQRPAPAPTLAEAVSRAVSAGTNGKARKQLERRVEVISPPTSPERPAGASAPLAGVS